MWIFTIFRDFSRFFAILKIFWGCLGKTNLGFGFSASKYIRIHRSGSQNRPLFLCSGVIWSHFFYLKKSHSRISLFWSQSLARFLLQGGIGASLHTLSCICRVLAGTLPVGNMSVVLTVSHVRDFYREVVLVSLSWLPPVRYANVGSLHVCWLWVTYEASIAEWYWYVLSSHARFPACNMSIGLL